MVGFAFWSIVWFSVQSWGGWATILHFCRGFRVCGVYGRSEGQLELTASLGDWQIGMLDGYEQEIFASGSRRKRRGNGWNICGYFVMISIYIYASLNTISRRYDCVHREVRRVINLWHHTQRTFPANKRCLICLGQ